MAEIKEFVVPWLDENGKVVCKMPPPPTDPKPLPVNEKFYIYIDDEGDFIVEAIRDSQYLSTHGPTPDEAVFSMRRLLDLAHPEEKQ